MNKRMDEGGERGERGERERRERREGSERYAIAVTRKGDGRLYPSQF